MDYRKTRWQVKDIKQKVNERERYGREERREKEKRGIKGGASGGRRRERKRS